MTYLIQCSKKETLFKKILNTQPQNNKYHNIILAVKHDKFKRLGIKKILSWGKNCMFNDIKIFINNMFKNMIKLNFLILSKIYSLCR